MTESVYVQVTFLDNSFKPFLVPPDLTAADFVVEIGRELGFRNVEEEGDLYFGFAESFTGSTLDRLVNKDEQVCCKCL
jgi:hypothetical protein